MKKRQNNFKKKRRSLNLATLFFIIFLVFIAKNIYNLHFKHKTILVTKPEVYEKIVPTQALVVRDEYVYSYQQSLQKKPARDRIPAGVSIGSIANYRNDLGRSKIELEKSLDQIREPRRLQEEELEAVQNDFFHLRDLIYQRDFLAIDKIFEGQRTNYELSAEERSSLEQQLQVYLAMVENQGLTVLSQGPGVVMTKLDGYETIYNYSNVAALDFPIALPQQEVQRRPGIKIIDNNNIALNFNIPTQDLLNLYSAGNDLKLKYKGQVFRATIDQMSKVDDQTTFVVRLDEIPGDFLRERFVKISLVNYRTQAFRLPKSSLVVEGQQKGYLVRSESGLVNFVPVDILSETKSEVIVHAGNAGLIHINNQELETIKEYDEVIKYPKLVKVGTLMP